MRINVGTKFCFGQIAILGPVFPERVFPVSNSKKSENYHRILHIPFGLGTKSYFTEFHLKLSIFIVLMKIS